MSKILAVLFSHYPLLNSYISFYKYKEKYLDDQSQAFSSWYASVGNPINGALDEYRGDNHVRDLKMRGRLSLIILSYGQGVIYL